jgi:thiazolinyl imide reductase
VFGQVYLEAFRRTRYPIELAGILARGNPRSVACAHHYGVPLYRSIAELGPDIDVACVVVRSGILGGKGSELARELLARGIHVLQEHPVHPDEMAELLRTARRARVQYQLNSFYVNVGPVRRFIGAARHLCAQSKPLFVDAACGCQLSFSLLDIIGHALGGLRPWTLDRAPMTGGEPFVTVRGTIASTPTTVRVQNQLDPADPDGFSYFMHRVSIGFPEGSLTLVDTHGPVVWTPRPQFPREVRTMDAAPQFASTAAATPRAAVIGSPCPPSFDEIFRDLWPDGVARALITLRRAIAEQRDPLRHGQQQLAVAEMWRDLVLLAGPPELVRGDETRPLLADDIVGVTAAAEAMELMP